MIQPKTIDKVIRHDTLDNPVCLLIVQNCISEPILDGLFANKNKFMEFASTYEMRIRRNDLDGTTTLVVKPKGTSSFSKIIQEVKSTQTMMDMKLVRDERNISNISNILNSILKLKNIKKPLARLPTGSEVARNLKSETIAKIFEQ
jgi:hypothetical protein